MSDDPAEWLRQLGEGIRVDPDIPPGVIVLESGGQRLARTASHPGGLVTPELEEDLRSFAESFPYTIRLSERGSPAPCEACGTPIATIPASRDGETRWKPGIWEHESLRKHTLRRCVWKLAHP